MTVGKLARSVSIIGAGYTPMGSVVTTPEIKDFSERELYAMACMDAMRDGNINAQDIDAFYLGSSGPNFNSRMKSAGTHFSEWIGMRNKPTIFHDEGCGTAGFGLDIAVQGVASGKYDCVISGAVNILSTVPYFGLPPYLRTTLPYEEWAGTINTGIDTAYEKPGTGGAGSIEAGLVLYCKRNGISFDEMTDAMINYMQVARRQALLNPKACNVTMSFQEEAAKYGFDNVHDYLTSNRYNPLMGSILRGKFVGLPCDGASAVIVCASERAKDYVDQPVEVAGIASATMLHKTYTQEPPEPWNIIFKDAYSMADVTDPVHEIQYFATHDCPVSTIIDSGEASGYFKPGTAWTYLRDQRTAFDGDRPINTTGGRNQMGHPTAPALGIEISEAVDQIRGAAGPRQIPIPPEQVVVCGGGSGWHCVASVLRAL